MKKLFLLSTTILFAGAATFAQPSHKHHRHKHHKHIHHHMVNHTRAHR